MSTLPIPVPPDQEPASRLASSQLVRDRIVERAGTVDPATAVGSFLAIGVLIATAVTRSLWALLPLAVLLSSMAAGPPAVRRSRRPEYTDLFLRLSIATAMAAAAGLSGGSGSPIVYLLPIGMALNGLRGSPTLVAIVSTITGVVFLAATLVGDAARVWAEPLPTVAVLVGLAGVTAGGMALAGAEIWYRKVSSLDALTGLLNRQGLEARFEELRQQAGLSDAVISMIVFDLDHFKDVNDRHGHDAGDRVLREVAYEVRKNLRRFELAYRLGGEEFLLLLPGMEVEDAEETAEHLRSIIADTAVDGIRVTASFGVAGAAGASIEFQDLYRRADGALYRAKREGRDRVASDREPALLV